MHYPKVNKISTKSAEVSTFYLSTNPSSFNTVLPDYICGQGYQLIVCSHFLNVKFTVYGYEDSRTHNFCSLDRNVLACQNNQKLATLFVVREKRG